MGNSHIATEKSGADDSGSLNGAAKRERQWWDDAWLQTDRQLMLAMARFFD